MNKNDVEITIKELKSDEFRRLNRNDWAVFDNLFHEIEKHRVMRAHTMLLLRAREIIRVARSATPEFGSCLICGELCAPGLSGGNRQWIRIAAGKNYHENCINWLHSLVEDKNISAVFEICKEDE
jgi:hypothetical protein